MNLLSLAKDRFTQETLTDLASLLGVDPEVIPRLLEQALPTIFSIFKASAADATKAPLLEQLLSQADASLLENPAEALGSRGTELQRSGKSSLARLLGPQLTDYIAPLAKTTGLGEGKIASSLGALAPFVLSLLASQASNVAELQPLLAGQELDIPAPDSKAPPKEAPPEKSYLPDPTKKKERRPRKKRRLAVLGFIVALLGGGGYYLAEEQPDWLKDIPLLDNLLETPHPPQDDEADSDEWTPVERGFP